MALDETTRQVNRRAIAALEAANVGLDEAELGVTRARIPLHELGRVTNAHDEALEELYAVSNRIQAAREDIRRRWQAETEGER